MASPSGQGSPGAAGLLRGTRARSYGSLVSSPVRERRMEHQLRPGDTLQGLAVMYGVTVSVGGGVHAPSPGWAEKAAASEHAQSGRGADAQS